MFTPPYIIVGQYFKKNTGRAMSLSTIGAGIGTIALAPLENLLISQYGSFGALLLTGGIVFNIIVAGALFRPAPKHEDIVTVVNTDEKIGEAVEDALFCTQDRNSVGVEQAKGNEELWSSALNSSIQEIDTLEPEVQTEPESTGKCFRLRRKFEIFSSSSYLVYIINIGCMGFVLMTPMIYLPSLVLEMGYNKQTAALMLSLVGLADIIGRFLFGFIFDLRAIQDEKRRRLMFGILGNVSTPHSAP